MTYSELIYICKDILKIMSDDAAFEDEHIIFLAGKYRDMLLKRYYDTPKKSIPDSAYQTISIDLKKDNEYNICGGNVFLKSTKIVPYTMQISNNKVYPINYFLGNIEYISKERFRYAGNKYLKNIIFATIGPDNYLYLKSANSQFLFLERVMMTAIFENSAEASRFVCNKNCELINIMDQTFPIEDALVPELLELILKELAVGLYHPADNVNNAQDDLSDIMTFIRQNMKDKYLKENDSK